MGEYVRSIRFDEPCAYCRGKGGSIDHIVPTSRGGEFFWQNYASACKECNSRKSDAPMMLFIVRRGGLGSGLGSVRKFTDRRTT